MAQTPPAAATITNDDNGDGAVRDRLLALAVGVLLIAGLVAIPFVGDRAERTDAATIIAAAEAVATPGSGLRFESLSSFTIAGQIGAGYLIAGTAAGDGEADIAITFEGVPLPDYAVLSDGSTVVVEVPKENRAQAGGRPWASASIEASDLHQFGDITRQGLSRFLAGAAGRTSTVGRETVRGVPTTHHRVRVDANAVFSEVIRSPTPGGVRPGIDQLTGDIDLDVAPVDVWLDDDDRLRRMEVAVSFEGAFGRGQVTVRHEVVSYDAALEVALPPEDQVFPTGSLDALLPLLVPALSNPGPALGADG